MTSYSKPWIENFLKAATAFFPAASSLRGLLLGARVWEAYPEIFLQENLNGFSRCAESGQSSASAVVDFQRLSKHFGEQSFSCVLMLEELQYSKDWRLVLEEVLRVLELQGVLLLSVRAPESGIQGEPDDNWRFPKSVILALLEPFGEVLFSADEMREETLLGFGLVFRRTCSDETLRTWKRLATNAVVPHTRESLVTRDDAERFSDTIIFDQYSRYDYSSRLLNMLGEGKERRVLDVGAGELCLLERFLPHWQVTYADPLLESRNPRRPNEFACEIFSDELKKGSFDYVLAVDTFEHVPPILRPRFLERTLELAETGVVLAFPCNDDPVASRVDAHVNRVYERYFSRSYSWLHEHTLYGLPSAASVVRYFESRGLHVIARQHGYAPWLQELLGLVIGLNEFPEFQPIIGRLSEFFNSKLARFDNSLPGYRIVIVASRKPLPSIPANQSRLPSEGEALWLELREELAVGFVAYSGEHHERLLKSLSRLEKEILLRDREVERVGKLMEEQSAWAKSAAQEVELRDAEIVRLQGLLKEMTEWGQRSSEQLGDKLREIDSLRHTIHQLKAERDSLPNSAKGMLE